MVSTIKAIFCGTTFLKFSKNDSIIMRLSSVSTSGKCPRIAIAFSHEFEEGVDLFGFKGEIAQFIEEEQVVSAEMVEEFRGGAIGERCVEFIDEILCVIESPPVSGKECLTEDAAGQP